MTDEQDGFVRAGSVSPGVMKEIERRVALRSRLEAEWGRPLTDEEFLKIAEQPDGMKL